MKVLHILKGLAFVDRVQYRGELLWRAQGETEHNHDTNTTKQGVSCFYLHRYHCTHSLHSLLLLPA